MEADGHRQRSFLRRTAPLGAGLLAASAVGAIANREVGRRRVTGADLLERGLRIDTMWDLRNDATRQTEIEVGLQREWGEYAALGFESIEQMVAIAGRNILIVSASECETMRSLGAVQTLGLNVHGNPKEIALHYSDFRALTRPNSWRSARSDDDTVVLLQITTFEGDRGSGVGSLLRDTALYVQPTSVRFALTMTPVDASRLGREISDPAHLTPAMRFHARAGAEPVAVLPYFKPAEKGESRHGQDVVMMMYTRDDSGGWPPPAPMMRLHSSGPLQDAAFGLAHRLGKRVSPFGHQMGGPRNLRTLRSSKQQELMRDYAS